MKFPKTTPNLPQDSVNLPSGNRAHFSEQLLEKARKDNNAVLKDLESRLSGLSVAEANARVKRYGLNEIAREKRQSPLMRLLDNVKNPLIILLTALGVLSYLTGDLRATVLIFVMIVLGVALRFYQEMRADNAVDIAKESSDIILLENSLLVLEQGVLEGRRVFGNILKYIKMAASSNFGNMFSVVGASAFLPFLPMLPIQVLTNNLLYDFSQTTIPTDEVDADWLTKPRKWTIGEIKRFILFIGPISSIFDYITFFIMLYVFNAWNNPALFHTGWFVESLFTQTLIIHVIRTNKIPFIQSWASWPLIVTSLIIVSLGAWLTVSPLAETLGFVVLPQLYWLLLAAMLLCYAFLTQLVKTWFYRRFGA